MFLPKIKSIAFKLLIRIFIPDCRQVYRRFIEIRTLQRRIKHLLRIVTPADLQEAKLYHIAKRLNELQRLIDLLSARGFTESENIHKLNAPLKRILTQLDLIEKELLRLTRYTQL